MSKSELKLMVTLFFIFTLTFSSIMLYRANAVDPALDEVYSEIYGLNEKGEE